MAHATTAGPQTGDAPLAIHHSAPPAPSSPPRIPTDLAVWSSLELPPPPSSSFGLFGKLSGPWLIDPSGLTFVWVGFPPRTGCWTSQCRPFPSHTQTLPCSSTKPVPYLPFVRCGRPWLVFGGPRGRRPPVGRFAAWPVQPEFGVGAGAGVGADAGGGAAAGWDSPAPSPVDASAASPPDDVVPAAAQSSLGTRHSTACATVPPMCGTTANRATTSSAARRSTPVYSAAVWPRSVRSDDMAPIVRGAPGAGNGP